MRQHSTREEVMDQQQEKTKGSTKCFIKNNSLPKINCEEMSIGDSSHCHSAQQADAPVCVPLPSKGATTHHGEVAMDASWLNESRQLMPLRRRVRRAMSIDGVFPTKARNATSEYDGGEEDNSTTSHEELINFAPKKRPQPRRRSPNRRISPHNRPNVEANNNQKYQTLIPAEHPMKVLWDIITMILSCASAYSTHVSIRDRNYTTTPFLAFCEVWFFIDIILNFLTERKTAEGEVLRDLRSVCARYLTSWFVVDAISLIPWESLYIKPIIERQNKRGFLRKNFFRSRAVVRVVRFLRHRHFRLFGKVARHTKQHGVGARRLLRLVIKYVPKYILFLKNMKGIVVMRILRQVNWVRRFWRNVVVEDKDDATRSLTSDEMDFSDVDDDVDDFSSRGSQNSKPTVRVTYDWEDIDDGTPW